PEMITDDIIKGKYIVVFNEEVKLKSGEILSYEEGIQQMTSSTLEILAENQIPEKKLGYVYGFALDGFSAELENDELIRLRKDPRIKYIEHDAIVSAFLTTQPNATWGLDRVDQRNLPMDGNYTYEVTGSGVNAYIIDTGIHYSHNDFGGRASFGFDAFGGNGQDGNGHGTHVAGTVGGSIYGVAKQVNLIAVRVLDNSGGGTTTGVIAGMDWVAANAVSPAVANMSLGGGASTAIDDAVTNMFNAGVPVIVAAGNGNRAGRQDDACKYSPARAPYAYTIGATVSNDAKASYSNYGDCVDLFAPGSSITSAWHTSNTATNTISGTSMASPHVAGAAALFLQNNPGATAQEVYDALHENSTKNIVTNSSTAKNHLLYTLGFGDGSGGDPEPDPVAVTGVSVSPTTASLEVNETVQLVATVSPEDATNKDVTWSSDNTSVATVSSTGIVTGVGEGTTTITVTTDDGDYTATSSVTVTDSGDGEVGDNSPVINTFNVTNSTAGPWKRVHIDWAVSDEDGDLASVKLELFSGTSVLDSATISISGSSASGNDELRARNTTPDSVKITVTDSKGNSATETKAY
ncbi:MAG: S8 family serine peptidase, partial [Bacteroidales bacterium]